MSWNPLFSDIVDSSVWRLPPHVRVAWITILAMKDWRTHKLRTNAYLLADKAKITEDQAEEALKVFMEPDKYSLNPANEGRRLAKLENGEYVVLNGAFWSKKMAVEKRKEWDKNRKREERLAESSTGNNSPMDLPPGFPTTEEDAVAQCAIVAGDVPAETIKTAFHEAAGRGGRDYRGTQIMQFPNYVLAQWKRFGNSVPGTAKSKAKPLPGDYKPGKTYRSDGKVKLTKLEDLES